MGDRDEDDDGTTAGPFGPALVEVVGSLGGEGWGWARRRALLPAGVGLALLASSLWGGALSRRLVLLSFL